MYYNQVILKSSTRIQTCHVSASYLADEPGNKQENQNAVMVPTMAKEGVRHEGGEEGHLSVRLSYFHFPQLHLNGLETKSEVSCLNKENQQHWHRGCMSPWSSLTLA